jgi:flagellar hook-basal body complex protein FliE
MAIDPTMGVSGAEWSIQAPAEPSAPGVADGGTKAGGGFGDMLASSISSLTNTQTDAAGAAQAFATGQDVDPTSVVMAVEKAQLSMQMASTMRTKAVEAYQDIFHTQV